MCVHVSFEASSISHLKNEIIFSRAANPGKRASLARKKNLSVIHAHVSILIALRYFYLGLLKSQNGSFLIVCIIHCAVYRLKDRCPGHWTNCISILYTLRSETLTWNI